MYLEDEWMDRQEELAGEERLKSAVYAALAAGVDVQAVTKFAVDAYKMLHKPVVGQRAFGGVLKQLVERGIRTEQDLLVDCLNTHTEEALERKDGA